MDERHVRVTWEGAGPPVPGAPPSPRRPVLTGLGGPTSQQQGLLRECDRVLIGHVINLDVQTLSLPWRSGGEAGNSNPPSHPSFRSSLPETGIKDQIHSLLNHNPE